MKCLILFSGKNKKHIMNLLSGKFNQRAVKVRVCTGTVFSVNAFPRVTEIEQSLGGSVGCASNWWSGGWQNSFMEILS